MTDVVLTLGDFTFTRFEVPEEIGFGGAHMLAVKKLVGGARVIDAMGADPRAPEWSGIFTGPNAVDRARYLDGLRKAGNALPLTWHELRYTVIIASFQADFRAPFRVPYRITCEVVSDDTASISTPPDTDSDAAIADDTASATGLAGQIGDSTLSGLVGQVSSATAAVSHFASAAREQINAVVEPIAAAQSQISLLRASFSNTLTSVASFGGLLPNTPIAQGAQALVGQINAATQLGRLSLLSGTLGRIQANVEQAPTGPKRVTVAGTDLYRVAADQYGNAMAWTTLARANGLIDPVIADAINLAVPSTQPDTSGILNA